MTITFQRSNNSNPDFQKFCEELDKEFWIRYPDSQQNFEPYNKVNESARIILAYDGNSPVGCGCFRPVKDSISVEIKRMYVRPECRGAGIARRILAELEKWAGEEGYSLSILETGIKQPEAIALYLRTGYQQIPNYPPYVDVAESICMKKQLRNSR
ncbi:MAG TPA: GNAT family N-acetyltransferase [Anaerolineales bacterium]|nr:GNAT family N-acetyltransferase [Anaerolineales bacterium]